MREADTTTERLREIVVEAYTNGGFKIMSDFARSRMMLVAMAASQHLITTQSGKNEYGRVWRITSKGLRWLNEMDN